MFCKMEIKGLNQQTGPADGGGGGRRFPSCVQPTEDHAPSVKQPFCLQTNEWMVMCDVTMHLFAQPRAYKVGAVPRHAPTPPCDYIKRTSPRTKWASIRLWVGGIRKGFPCGVSRSTGTGAGEGEGSRLAHPGCRFEEHHGMVASCWYGMLY